MRGQARNSATCDKRILRFSRYCRTRAKVLLLKRHIGIMKRLALLIGLWLLVGLTRAIYHRSGLFLSVPAVTSVRGTQDPRRPPPNPGSPDRSGAAAITFGGKTSEEVLPNPYRFQTPPEKTIEAVDHLLKDLQLELDKEKSQPRAGIFLTTWYVFSRGITARSELARVADMSDQEIHNWTAARYRLDIRINLVEPNASLVTVMAEIEGRSQDVLTSAWIKRPSKGVIENNILRSLRERLEAR